MNPNKPKNWKLIIDPFIIKGSTKLFRYEGQVPGDPTYPVVHLRDPRSQISRIWSRLDVLDLPIPRFRVFHLNVIIIQLIMISIFFKNIR